MQWPLSGVNQIVAAVVVGLAIVGGSFGAGYLVGGRNEARIQIKEVEKRIEIPVERIREVQVRNVEVERKLMADLAMARSTVGNLQARLDQYRPIDCDLDPAVVRLYNEAVSNHPSADPARVPDSEVNTPSVRDVERWTINTIGQYNDLSIKHDALVNWVEKELVQNASRN